MPKGIYNRSKSVTVQETRQSPIVHEQGINKIRVSQMPDHQTANAGVEAVRQSHGDEEISTTERLFGSPEQQAEDNNEDTNIKHEPLVVQPVAQNPEEAEQPRFKESNSPAPVEPTPQEDEFIDWDKMSGRKIRQKIDGKEVVTTVEELKKYSDQDQIKKHLAEAAEKVGQERRKLAEERQQWNEQRNRPIQYEAPSNQAVGGQQSTLSNLPPPQDPVFQRLQSLEQQVQQLAQGVQPSIYESNRQRVANELKSQGFNDFMEYLPKMESAILGIKDPNLTSFYDTPEGSKSLYFQLKAQDLQKAPARPIQPQVVPRGNPVPPQVQIESGSQPSGNFNDDSGNTYRTAFRRAINSGDDKESWNDVLRQKIPHIMGD